MSDNKSNELIILDSIFNEAYNEKYSFIEDKNKAFELYTSEQILKDYDLSYDEISDGIVDGGNDGGLDAVYLFINDQLSTEEILEDDNLKNFLVKDVKIKLFLIQSKKITTFKKKVLESILSTTKDVFNLGKELKLNAYNQELINKINLFRAIVTKLASKHPKIEINYYYVTEGDKNDINPSLDNIKNQIIEEVIKSNLPRIEAKFDFIGASELIESSRQLPNYNLGLKFQQTLSADSCYILLVKISDYYEFLTDRDNNKNIRGYLFEANIRDYQGKVEVNKDIKATLESTSELAADFWWLNNGITIITTKASITNQIIYMDNIQIVNGLQTSYSICETFDSIAKENLDKKVLIRVIQVDENSPVVDEVIKATNFQTPIALPSFRASDKIQKDIEDYLKSTGLFYDRRKNHYKNQGKRADLIVTIQLMAQAVNCLILKDPGLSRRSPASLVKNEDTYKNIFGYKNMKVYGKSITIMKKVLEILKNYTDGDYLRSEKLDFQYHIALNLMQNILNNKNYTEDDIVELDISKITEVEIIKSLKYVIDKARKIAEEKGSTTLAVAKSKDFTESIRKAED